MELKDLFACGAAAGGRRDLATGCNPLVEKKGKYRLRDFTGRGAHEKLGLPEDGGRRLPHRRAIPNPVAGRKSAVQAESVSQRGHPNRERLRLVAQALARTVLERGRRRVGE
ncbi:MAG: hypothetical protein NNA18_03295 [Nitrospira sp.]|nr:hypothetical protein [Nitrospira sp.]